MATASPGLALGARRTSGRRAARTTFIAWLCGLAMACGARTGLLVGGAPDTVDSGAADSGQPDARDEGPLPAQQTMVLFGGLSELGGQYLSDTWEWDGNVWTQRSSSGPAGRMFSAMASFGPKVVLFGGNGTMFFSDTWEWDGAAWTQDGVIGPAAREGHAMATLGDKVVLFGGSAAGGTTDPFADTWEWGGSAWTQRNVVGPSARSGHAMVTLGNKLVLFGGATSTVNGRPVYLGDTWEWDGNRWTERSVVGPSGRNGHAMATLDGKVVLYGGWDGQRLGGDTWEWDGNVWTQRNVSGPGSREMHTMATANGRVVLFGGTSGNPDTIPSDTWEWDGTSWTQRATSGPSARQSGAAAGR